jgi:hypothetical protein
MPSPQVKSFFNLAGLACGDVLGTTGDPYLQLPTMAHVYLP